MARKDGIAVEVTGADALGIEADALALPVFAEEAKGGGAGRVKELDRQLGGALALAMRAERFEGKPGQELALATVGRAKATRVHLVGLGAREAAAARGAADGLEALRAGVGKASRAAAKAGARSFAVALPERADDVPGAARAAAEGALLGAYEFVRYKTDGEKRPPGLARVRVAVPAGR